MKKIFTNSFLLAVCLGFFTGCSKDVKAPKKPVSPAASSTTTTYTTPESTNQDHQGGCGNGSHTSDSGNGY